MRIDRRKKESLWLLNHTKQVTSQHGEDGVIEKIFEVIGTRNKWCVEFGAWDGITHSNTYNLIANHGWSSLQIEANTERFQELVKTHAGHPTTVCVNALVGFDPRSDSLEFHLRRARAPLDIDLAVIDVDGNDWHIWQSMARYRPRLLVIEFNSGIPNDVYFVQDKDPKVNHGSSLRALMEFGKRRNYELVATLRGNAFFVEKQDFPKFGISDNSIDAMWHPERDASLFLLYDGTLVNVGLSRVGLRQADPKPRDIDPFAFQVYSEEERGFAGRATAPEGTPELVRGSEPKEAPRKPPQKAEIEPRRALDVVTPEVKELRRIFLPDGMHNTPFASDRWLAVMGVAKTDRFEDAEIVAVMRTKALEGIPIDPGKTYVLWTNEPFVSDTTADCLPLQGHPDGLHVFNVHNGQVYTDNFFYCDGAGAIALIETEADLNVSFADKTVSVAAALRDWPLVVEGVDRSLCRKRASFALDLYKRKQAKIIGKNWPGGVALADSRNFERARTKAAFLRGTNFNLCPENTDADYLVTEKIWEAISAGCLPIYHANATIYQVFPRGSFADMRDFRDGNELGEFLAAMSFEDYRRRINLCREVYNHAIRENFRAASWQRTLTRMRRFFESHLKRT
jgi:hypothetical protein